MPPKRESAQQKAQRLMKAGRKLRVKADYVTVCQCLRDREDLISFFREELVERGELQTDGEGNLVVVGKVERASPVKREADTQALAAAPVPTPEEPESPQEQPADTRDTKDETIIHRNFSTWHLVPPAHLQAILEGIEPITCSGGNLRAFIKRGCRSAPRSVLLELLEFTVDVDPSSSVGEDRVVSSIIDKFRARNEYNGRRGRELRFPHNWQEVGIFELSIAEPVLTIRERRTGESIVVAGIAVQRDDASRITIDNNYSKLRASLVFSSGRPSINIAHEFAKGGVLLVEGSGIKGERSLMGSNSLGRGSPSASFLKRSSSNVPPYETPPAKRRLGSDAGDSTAHVAKSEAPHSEAKLAKGEQAPPGMAEEVTAPLETIQPQATKQEETCTERARPEGAGRGGVSSSSASVGKVAAKQEEPVSAKAELGADEEGPGADATTGSGSLDEGDFVPPGAIECEDNS